MQQIQTNATKTTKKNILFRISDVQGGVSLVLSTLVVGKVVPEGTPLTAPSSGKRTVCKQAKILTGSTTTVFRVNSEENNFKVGDILFQVAGGAAYAITTIGSEVGTVDGVVYDTLTVGTALESAAVGTFIYESNIAAGVGAATGALENVANAITKEAFTVPSTSQVIWMSDAFVRADVHYQIIGALYLATLPGIIEVQY